MVEKPGKRGPKVEIIGDPARIGEDFRKASSVFAGLDKALVPSLAETFGALSTKSILGDFSALQAAAKSIAMPPTVAPQIAEALAGFTVPEPLPKTVAAAMAAGIDKMRVDLMATTVGGSYAGALPQIAKMLQTIALPKPIGTQIADAIAARPHRSSELAPRVQASTEEAIALAEVADVAEIVDSAIGPLESVSAARAHTLALEVAALVAAFLVLAAYLRQGGELDDPKGAGIALAYAAALVRVYWRLVGKLD
jgi:hypothetical protein